MCFIIKCLLPIFAFNKYLYHSVLLKGNYIPPTTNTHYKTALNHNYDQSYNTLCRDHVIFTMSARDFWSRVP